VVIAVILVVALAVSLIIFVPFLISEIEKLKVSYLDYLDILRAKVEIVISMIKSYNIPNIIIERTRDSIFLEVQKISAYFMNIFSIFSIMVLISILVFLCCLVRIKM
jgi:predicted PurR-regulated permease PerM